MLGTQEVRQLSFSRSTATGWSKGTSINDPELINWFKSNYKRIDFIIQRKYDSYGRADKLFEAIKKLKPDKELYLQKDEVTEIWRNLVGKAIIYLKSKDEREKYHDGEDYGVEKLSDFYKGFRKFEPLLYGAEEERYRDHMAHMLSVFLLGEYLIRETIGFNKIDVDDKNLPKNNRIRAGEKEAMWCIMSLTHDLGVALEKIPIISSGATDMLEEHGIIDRQALSFQFPRQPLHDSLIQFISSDLRPLSDTSDEQQKQFFTHVQSKYYLKFAEAFEKRDHGLISALILMKNLVYFLESDFSLDRYGSLTAPDAKQFLIRRNILRAIAAHNCGNIYYLTLPQFAFLLTTVDEMHEWGRPRLIDMFTRERPDTEVFVEDLNETAIHYKVELNYKDKGALSDQDRERMRGEACKYFVRKCQKIRMILRSAVGGELRKPKSGKSQLRLTLEVADKVNNVNYKIIHGTPEDIEIREDDKETTWLELLERLAKLKP